MSKDKQRTRDVQEGRLDAAQLDENFIDLHPPLNEMQSAVEAARCLFCFDAPCTEACPTGIDIRKVVETGITPRVNTGIAHKDAGVGQIGAGLVRPPMSMFEEALVAYAEKYGF